MKLGNNYKAYKFNSNKATMCELQLNNVFCTEIQLNHTFQYYLNFFFY